MGEKYNGGLQFTRTGFLILEFIVNLPSACRQLSTWLSSVIILMTCLWAGNHISQWIGHLLPGSILGMLLLASILGTGAIKLTWIEPGANLLIRWMALLFVPIGVGVVDKLDLLANSLWALLLTCAFGTCVVMAITGWVYQWLERFQS